MSKRYGFYLTLGRFGAGKTQAITRYLHDANRKVTVNISNYWTGYSDFQIQSHEDLLNILSDIYDYHQYINLYKDRAKLYSLKPKLHLEEYEERATIFRSTYPNLPKDLWFNIALDEGGIYFNSRNFDKNFKGKNEALLSFIYQPRKLNCLFLCWVQNPHDLDVKFRRLATTWRHYKMGLYFIRWYHDYYVLNPDDPDLSKAEKVGFGMHVNLHPFFPFPYYEYHTKELIEEWVSIYTKGSLFERLRGMGVSLDTPAPELRPQLPDTSPESSVGS